VSKNRVFAANLWLEARRHNPVSLFDREKRMLLKRKRVCRALGVKVIRCATQWRDLAAFEEWLVERLAGPQEA
jgi:hypothetical protein